MRTTVHFATNRVVAGPADAVASYSASIQPTAVAGGMVYGTAFVENIDVPGNAQGDVGSIQVTQTGGFPQSAIDDLSQGGRNLLVFLHGFDNSFSDALTRAAFNREWMAAAGGAADCTVVAFSWPSLGRIADLGLPQADYLRDQNIARHSGLHTMTFLANLQPILQAARSRGRRSYLLAHSMGNLALESAVENWFLNGNGPGAIFDLAILAAGDCGSDTFRQPSSARLSGLAQLAKRVSIYYSHADHVLQLSRTVNGGAQRLGENGPLDRSDPAAFPQATYYMADATSCQDYDFGFLASHQYYRQSPKVRALIAADMAR